MNITELYEISNSFRKYVENNLGSAPDSIEETDGKPVRWGDGYKKPYWYFFNIINGHATGTFGDWRTGSRVHWESDREYFLTLEGHEAQSRLIRERDLALKQKNILAVIEAITRLSSCELLTPEKEPTHYYLKNKKIKAHFIYSNGPSLFIPYVDFHDQLMTYQRIDLNGFKQFGKDMKKGDSHFLVQGRGNLYYICEGYSTGASIHEATGCNVIVCGSLHVVEKVLLGARNHLSFQNEYILALDNDCWSDKNTNPGLKTAREISMTHGVKYTTPSFDEKFKNSKPTDFNDLAVLCGHAEVVRQLNENLKEEVAKGGGSVSFKAPTKKLTKREKNHTTINPVKDSIMNYTVPIDKSKRYPREKEILSMSIGYKKERYKCNTRALRQLVEADGYKIRYNELTNHDEINGKILTDHEVLRIREEYADRGIEGEKKGDWEDTLRSLAIRNAYNPFKEVLDENPWDGKSHINALFNELDINYMDSQNVTELRNLYYLMFRRWIIGVVSKAMKDGSENFVLLFYGGQGIGKTKFARRFQIYDGMCKSGSFNPTSKDDRLTLTRCLIQICDEFDGITTKSDREALKACITTNAFTDRDVYGKRAVTRYNICSFIGSTNSKAFLNDETGNRRFMIIPVHCINYQHKVDMVQVFAEATAAFKEGERYWFDQGESSLKEKLVDSSFMSTDIIDDIAELIKPGHDVLNAGEIGFLYDKNLKLSPKQRSKLTVLLEKAGCKYQTHRIPCGRAKSGFKIDKSALHDGSKNELTKFM